MITTRNKLQKVRLNNEKNGTYIKIEIVINNQEITENKQ